MHEGDGFIAYQKVDRLGSAVAGVALAQKMKLAMSAVEPNKASEVAAQQ